MTSKDDDPRKPGTAPAGKAALKARRAHNEARLAEALRANLGRRKEQARARSAKRDNKGDTGGEEKS